MPVLNIGLPDSFIEQGTREELLAICGLDIQGITAQIEIFCA
jgi:1-deoxy-D-xylulose-5-phosphate synthase